MSKFLQQVADYYISRGEDIGRYCFVFPNKRSGMFMRKYIKDALQAGAPPAYMPRFVTMSHFVSTIGGDATPAPQAELLLVLYKAYGSVMAAHGRGEHVRDFDSFIYWGDMMLRDFDDVDAYMVDPEQLFLNLKRVKEISANYLTRPQLDAVRQIWGDVNLRYDIDSFWNHIPDESIPQSPSARFITLWEMLGEIYAEFKRMLAQSTPPLTYSGAIYRDACDIIREMSADEFDSRRYVFVGFNHLSTSQIEIFRHMKEIGIADFFWDIASPEFYHADGSFNLANKAVRFVSRHAEQFPMPDGFSLQPIAGEHDMEVIAVPSSMAQAKVTSAILSDLFSQSPQPNGRAQKDKKLLDTAVVLPDESLLVPMLYSLPPEVDRINITMGLPYTATPFAALFSGVISMQMRAREIRGVWHFYYDDVLQVLSYPHIRMLDPTETDRATEYITSSRLYNIDVTAFGEKFPLLAWLFEPVRDLKDIAGIRTYMTRLIDNLDSRLSSLNSQHSSLNSYETLLLKAYRNTLVQLCDLFEAYGITVQGATFFTLLERTLRHMTLNLSGTPLQGMQVMGVLETRSLDFENIILLSMNERTFPRRMYTASLIPTNLRRGYNLPTIDTQEADYAYHFYRLISRAKKVRILYDSRAKGASSGEMSRYLQQLRHLSTLAPRLSALNFPTAVADNRVITVHKTPEVVEQLHRFRPGGNLNISASALKAYRKCPLMFYLQYVCRLRDTDDAVDYMDAATYGTIVHKVVEDLYSPYKGKQITTEVIDNMIASDLIALVYDTIDLKYHNGRYRGRHDDLPGESRVLGKIIALYIRHMLSEERKLTPFTFVDAEFGGGAHPWAVTPDITVNFKMSIDRIDRTPDGRLRFIDYKTGSDKIKASSVAGLFSDSHYSSNDAIFQLLTYCHAYCDIFGSDDDIQPVIYKFMSIATDGLQPLTIGKEELTTHKHYTPEFMPLLQDMFEKIFEENDDHPFTQTDRLDNCRYCPFLSMCSRSVPEY